MLQQPLSSARIEIAEALPVEGMASVVIQMQVRSGKSGGHFLAHPFRGEGVVLPADDECGTFDILELIERVVTDSSSALCLHGMHGLRSWVEGGIFQALLHVIPTVIVVEPRLGENKHLHVVHEVFGTHRGLALHEVLPSVKAEAVLPRPSAHEDHALHLVWMTEGELLGDNGAERAADNTRLLDAELIHEASIIVRHHRSGIGTFGFVGLTHAAIVTKDAPEVLFPGLRMCIPHTTGSCHSHDADERITATAFLIKHFDTVGFDVGHDLE
jgi:hypothetical protein